MASVTTRSGKGSALTHSEMDTNLNQIPNGSNSSITDDGSLVTLTSPLISQDGTATTPAIQIGDSNCGLFDSGSDAIGVALNGIQKMTFKANGEINATSFVGDGSGLTDLSLNDTGWISLTPYLSNGWVVTSAIYPVLYKKVGDTVFIQGLVKDGTSSTVFTGLPTSIRPPHTIYLAPAYETEVVSNWHAITVDTGGTMQARTYDPTVTSIAITYNVGA